MKNVMMEEDLPSLDGRLVRITYRDHVLFRDLDVQEVPFDRRESVGWYLNKDAESIIIVHDRSLISEDPWDERHAVGLVLLRDLLEEVIPID